MKKPRDPLELTSLDNNKEIRAALIKRINNAAEKTPVVLLHQIAQILEQYE